MALARKEYLDKGDRSTPLSVRLPDQRERNAPEEDIVSRNNSTPWISWLSKSVCVYIIHLNTSFDPQLDNFAELPLLP